MPVLSETEAPEQRKRSARGAWLLLVPPAFGVALLLAAGVQPLQLGPYVLVTLAQPAPGFGWKSQYVRGPSTGTGPGTADINGHPYRVEGDTHALLLGMGDYGAAAVLFQGHRGR